MYELNLIREKIVPIGKQRKRLSLFSFYILIWCVTAVVFFYYYYTSQTEIETYASAKRQIESRNALPSGVTNEDVASLAKQLDVAREALKATGNASFLWSTRLARLRHFLPADAWMDALTLRRSTTRFKTAEKGKPPSPFFEFVIQGTVLLPEDGMSAESIEKFVSALRADPQFMAKVKEMNHIVLGRERYGTREIAKFQIVCVIEENVRLG